MTDLYSALQDKLPTTEVEHSGNAYEVHAPHQDGDAAYLLIKAYETLHNSTSDWSLRISAGEEGEQTVVVTVNSRVRPETMLEAALLLNHAIERKPVSIVLDVPTGICRLVIENLYEVGADQEYMNNVWRSSAARVEGWVNPPAVVNLMKG